MDRKVFEGGITSALIRAGNSWKMTLTGNHLLGGEVTTDNPGITVVSQKAADLSVSATFAVALTAHIGVTTVTVTTPEGATSVPITVALPSLSLFPKAIRVQKGTIETITATLAETLKTDISIDLTVTDTDVATVPASITIPIGQLSSTFQVAGVAVGFATLFAQIHGTTATPISVSITTQGPVGGPTALVTQPLSIFYSHVTVNGGLVTGPVSVSFAHLGSGITGGQVTQPVSVSFAHLGSGTTGGQISLPLSVYFPHLGAGVSGGLTAAPVSVQFGQ